MKNKLKTIRDVSLESKRIVLRVDFNVPVKNGKVLDDYKIERALPTIKYLLKRKCKIVLISHFGRPEGKSVKILSLAPVYRVLKKKLKGIRVKFFSRPLTIGNHKLPEADIVVLENIRFEKMEDDNKPTLAKILSRMGEVFVNEAFAASHRENASTVGITKLLPSFAGLNFENEVNFLSKALKPKKPAVALIGGAKVETKFQVVKNFLKIYNKVMLGGGLANTFLAARGYDVGGSLFEPSEMGNARRLLKSPRLILPIDVVIFDKKKQKTRVEKIGRQKKLCRQQDRILDIGPETIIRYAKYIRWAETIIWAGPLGLFEVPMFSHGTLALAKLIGARASGRALGIAGGGETLLAIHMSKMGRYYDFISTGGGAMLEFLEGKNLPGIKALINNK